MSPQKKRAIQSLCIHQFNESGRWATCEFCNITFGETKAYEILRMLNAPKKIKKQEQQHSIGGVVNRRFL